MVFDCTAPLFSGGKSLFSSTPLKNVVKLVAALYVERLLPSTGQTTQTNRIQYRYDLFNKVSHKHTKLSDINMSAKVQKLRV